jgi:FkbM family methyltransferase
MSAEGGRDTGERDRPTEVDGARSTAVRGGDRPPERRAGRARRSVGEVVLGAESSLYARAIESDVVSHLRSRSVASALESTARTLGLDALVSAIRTRAVESTLPPELVFHAGGMATRLHVGNEWEYRTLRKYERDPDKTVLLDFLGRLRPTDVVWDVGAHVGVFTCFSAAGRPPERTVAIEPLPRNAERIRANLALNGRDATVRRLALSDGPGETTVRTTSPDAAGAFGTVDPEAGGGVTRVSAVAGDTLIERGDLSPPTVAKIDVQGAELGVLRGIRGSIARDCRLVYCNVYEKHADSAAELRAVRDLLADAGLGVTRLADWSGGYFIRATRDADSTGEDGA